MGVCKVKNAQKLCFSHFFSSKRAKPDKLLANILTKPLNRGIISAMSERNPGGKGVAAINALDEVLPMVKLQVEKLARMLISHLVTRVSLSLL